MKNSNQTLWQGPLFTSSNIIQWHSTTVGSLLIQRDATVITDYSEENQSYN